MPHIHTEPGHYDQTVTAYIVRTDLPEPQVLVHMHRKLNKLLPVGGHVELNETPWLAIAHELQEESGYTLNDLQILQPAHRISNFKDVTFHPYPVAMNTHAITPDHFHSDIDYAFVANALPDVSVAEGESTDLRWLTKEELGHIDSSLIFDNTKDVYNFILDSALTNWDAVPAVEFSLN